MADRVMVSLRLSPGGLAALDAAAAERGVGRSEAFRLALAQWLTGSSYRVPEGKVLVSKGDWEELCAWRRAEDEGNQFPPPLAVSSEPVSLLSATDKQTIAVLRKRMDKVAAEVGVNPVVVQDQTLITESWGKDKAGRRVWTGPVDADGNPVGDEGA